MLGQQLLNGINRFVGTVKVAQMRETIHLLRFQSATDSGRLWRFFEADGVSQQHGEPKTPKGCRWVVAGTLPTVGITFASPAAY